MKPSKEAGKITPEATPEQKKFEGGWTYEPEKLRQLTESVNKITDYEETVSMEQVEAVLMAINYPQFSEQWAGQATPVAGYSLEDLQKVRDEMIDAYFKSRGTCTSATLGNAFYEAVKSLKPATPVKRDEWINVNKELPVCPEKKEYIDVLCGWFGPKGRFNQFVGFYAEKHKVPYEDYDSDGGEYDPVEEANGTMYLKPGWYELEETPGGSYDEIYVSRPVTHWQPLPATPASIDKSNEAELK